MSLVSSRRLSCESEFVAEEDVVANMNWTTMPKRRNARTSERDAITAPHALIATRTINPHWHSIALFHVPWRSHQARDERLLHGSILKGG